MASMFQAFDLKEALSGDTHHRGFIDGGRTLLSRRLPGYLN